MPAAAIERCRRQRIGYRPVAMTASISVSVDERRALFRLDPGEEVVVGRGADCDVIVDETSVSRRHCSVALAGDRLVVTDLGSAHGLVRGRERATRCELRVGDTVRLGMAALRFEGLVAADPRAAASASRPIRLLFDGEDPLLGQTLGGYRLLALLGRGGFATVYRAEQVQLGREVALKVLRRPTDGAGEAALQAFLREARVAAALADPRLVQIFDFGVDHGRHFLSMELVRGGSLAQRLQREGPLPWAKLLPILRDVVGALQVAHAAGIVHRDVKPANVLLTGDGGAKLTDLGLVGDAGGEGHTIGTAAYMAPEQLRGEPVDGRADLYALGCTAWAALTGRPPFVGSRKDIVQSQLRDEPPPLPAGLVPPGVESLLRRHLLAKRPQDRPADAAELLALLERAERAVVVVRPRGAVHRRAARRVGSGDGLLWAVALLAVAGAVAAYFLLRAE